MDTIGHMLGALTIIGSCCTNLGSKLRATNPRVTFQLGISRIVLSQTYDDTNIPVLAHVKSGCRRKTARKSKLALLLGNPEKRVTVYALVTSYGIERKKCNVSIELSALGHPIPTSLGLHGVTRLDSKQILCQILAPHWSSKSNSAGAQISLLFS